VSPELNELRDSARAVLSGAGVAADEARAWPSLVELGWLMVATPEESGGLGQGLAGACAIYTEMGRALATAPYTSAMLALDAVQQSAREDRDAWIERMMAGEYVAASLADASLTVSSGAVNGDMAAVPSADKATHFLVLSDAHIALVPREADGVTVNARQTWDKTRRLFDVGLNNAKLSPDLVLAEGAVAANLAERIRAHRDFALAADAVGGAASILDITVEYLKTRSQYGRPLAMFQALKHRCADLKAAATAAEALLFGALDRVEADTEVGALALLGKKAKHFACATYAAITEESVQLHGGIGMTSEHPCHLYLKRALLNQHLGRAGNYEVDIAAGALRG